MKANELMIGYLVLVDDGQQVNVRKVASITRKKIGYHKEDGETRMWHAPLCSVKPIPLTEEILKVNGFRRIVETSKRMRKDNPSEICIHRKIRFLCVQNPDTTSVYYISIVLNGNTIIMYPTDKGEWVKSINLKTPYVHELQHAIRLCGYNELADNFKVSPN